MTEEQLVALLSKIQTLHARAGTEGERRAAAAAADRIRGRLRKRAYDEAPVEYRFTIRDPWARKLFFALLRREGLDPYRYPRQRRQTIMVRVRRSVVDARLWPEFEELSARLTEYLEDVTDRVITSALHSDFSDAELRHARF
ncbi:MAG: hypothetical protein ACYTG3_19730 [Planctomycetota bacterium]